MKKRSKTFRKTFFLVLLGISVLNISAQIRFEQGSSFRYLKGNAVTEPTETLLSRDYNDNSWASGQAPFRYGKGEGGTLLSDMQNNYTCFFLRTEFEAQNAERLEQLNFSVNYDDGFIIAINGQIVLSENVPPAPDKNALALINHNPGTFENFSISTAGMELIEGTNSLAVMVLNVSSFSSDIYFDLAISAEPALPPFPYSNNVQINHEAGFYTEPFDLIISSPYPDCSIRFSFDGSDPATSSTAVNVSNPSRTWRIDPEQPVSRGLTPGYMLRACLIKEGFKPSASITNTYIFTHKVKTQSYPGWKWPTSPHNGQSLDYEMDPAVVYDEVYAPHIDAALMQIPTISIVTDMDNLFSITSGIYVNAEKSGRAWERPCSIELIDTCNTKRFQINGGMRIRGAASAKQKASPKRAFRFYFREEYGASKLRYPLFGNEGVSEFDRIDLRCEQNYSWSKDGSKYNSLIADIFSRDLQGRMKHPYKKGRYYHLFLNGMYWGIYQTDERAQADYAETYFGGHKDDYDVVKVNSDGWPYFNEATDGNLDIWTALWNKSNEDFASDANYLALQGKLPNGSPDPEGRVWVDMDNLIDYMLIIFYTGNFDAPVSAFYGDDMPNNYYAIYNRNDHSKGFRFFAHDSEHSLFIDNIYAGGLNNNRVNIGTNGSMQINRMLEFNPQWLHFKLTNNAEYKLRFMDRAYRHLTTGGLLSPDSTSFLYQHRAAQIDQAVIAESARWGDAISETALTKNDWEDLLKSMYSTFFPKRSNIVIQQLNNEGLYPSMAAPRILISNVNYYGSHYRFSGELTVMISDASSGQSNSIYYTLDGSDPRTFGGGISATALSGSRTISLSLNQSTMLKSRIYSGSSWGPLKQVFFSRPDEDFQGLKITEIHYHPKDTFVNTTLLSGQDFEFIEFKNTGNKAIDLSGLKIDSGIYHRFPEEQLLYPGEFYVAASKPNNFFLRYGRYPSGSFSKNLANSGEKIVLFNRDNQALIDFNYYDNTPWPATPDGEGYSLTSRLASPEDDPGDYSYWMASSLIGGSPFADDPGSAAAISNSSLVRASLDVYPNPSKGIFFVNTGQTSAYRLRIYDSKAVLVFDRQFEGIATIDLGAENLSRGLYIVRAELLNEVLSTKLIYLP